MAVLLAALAGYLDGIGFLQLNGFFVSFMSGNSTRLGVGLGGGELDPALLAGAIILCFLAGVILGSLAGRAAGQHYRLAVLISETATLLLAALLQTFGQDKAALGAIILATGIENSVFQRDGVVTTGLTYVTGALVKTGQRIAGALVGETPFAWLPSLLLWAGFVLGAGLGAVSYRWIGLQAIWGAFACASAVSAAEFAKTRSFDVQTGRQSRSRENSSNR